MAWSVDFNSGMSDTAPPSTDGSCGPSNGGTTCEGTEFGNCCSLNAVITLGDLPRCCNDHDPGLCTDQDGGDRGADNQEFLARVYTLHGNRDARHGWSPSDIHRMA
ncbi:hypothetical protein B0H67DRAFT_648684 [Lasiosphaeris hirsuta]|uniref:Uncharacterized protein n=1 Tax=Lasiosphaeris hirsuta TaxID=260670 RepID=A0AA40DPG3_9PEZI|nr:hypothetical protein B0H67DRAFT_648684 [Lasiosphaeris hirsuta]